MLLRNLLYQSITPENRDFNQPYTAFTFNGFFLHTAETLLLKKPESKRIVRSKEKVNAEINERATETESGSPTEKALQRQTRTSTGMKTGKERQRHGGNTLKVNERFFPFKNTLSLKLDLNYKFVKQISEFNLIYVDQFKK